MLAAIQILLLATVGFCVVYLFMLSVLSLFAQTPRSMKATRHRRFAAVIPAHNEEHTIAPTIRSLVQTEYPREHFDVIVVADNCSDQTAEVSRENGAIVLERQNKELRGKGHALRWCFDQLLSQQGDYDAFIVVDADSIASANFFAVMNDYLEQGARVIQASDLVKPQPGAWSSEMTRLGFLLYNYVRPLGRRVIGCSVGLRGNGMCFAADVLRTHPWEAYSRAEDLEFGLHLLLHDILVSFAPEASVLATMPQNPQLAESQRVRWEGGRFPVIRKYAMRLLRNTFANGSIKSLDAFIDLVTPPLITLMGMVAGILFITGVLAMIGMTSMMAFAFVWAGVLLLGFLHMFIGLYSAHADAHLYRALLHLPRYALWKTALLLKLARHDKTTEWISTTREPAAVPENSTKV